MREKLWFSQRFPLWRLPLSIWKSLNSALGIRQTDLVRGYFEYLIPTLLIALVFWVLVRLSSPAQAILRSVGGVVVLFIPPLFWFYGHPSGWPYPATWLETAIAVLGCILFLIGKFSFPRYLALVLIAGHFAFWYWIYGSPYLANYVGPIGPMLGFLATLSWALYRTSDRPA